MIERIDAWYRKHRLVAIILAAILGLVVGALGAKWSNATAAIATPHSVSRGICTHNPEVPCSVLKHLKRFKAGKYGKVHGMGNLKFFAGPAAKKQAMIRLARIMPLKPFRAEKNATCAKAPKFACSHSKSSSRGGTREGHRRCMQSEICRAYNRWGETASAMTCIGVDQSYYHPSCNPYKLLHPSPQLTKHEVIVGVSLGLCAAGVVITVATKAGHAAGAVATSTCAWNFFRDTTSQ